MAIFKHPCLVRGTVHTPFGEFTQNRGLVDLPDDVGEALGWPRLDDEHAAPGFNVPIVAADTVANVQGKASSGS